MKNVILFILLFLQILFIINNMSINLTNYKVKENIEITNVIIYLNKNINSKVYVKYF